MSGFFSRPGTPTQGAQPEHNAEAPPSVSDVSIVGKGPYAEPIKGKPGYFVIEGQAYGPDSVFSKSARLKGKPYLRALAYVAGTCQERGQFDCEPGDHYLSPAELVIWHRGAKTVHVARNLGPACRKHASNSFLRSTSGGTRERKPSAGSAVFAEASSLESQKHDPQRAAWDSAIQNTELWAELKAAGCLTQEWQGGTYYLLADVTQIAVKFTVDPLFGKYSSETFQRYGLEDRFDVLEVVKLGGRWFCRLRGPKA